MEKMIYATAELPEDVLIELKRITGERTVKEALYKAIKHYLNCLPAEREQKIRRIREFEGVGRHPLYLKTLLEAIEKNE